MVQIEIAYDRTFATTLWGADRPHGVAVYARQHGRLGRIGGRVSGSAVAPSPSPLSPLSTWSANLSPDGAMLVVPGTPGAAPIPFRRVAG